MSTSALESEDLENIPLVRMEDVQPSRTYEVVERRRSDEEVVETCVIEDIEYDNECIVNNDDDSNIGSMVSIQSEEVVEDDSDAEMIVPEVMDKISTKKNTSEVYRQVQNPDMRAGQFFTQDELRLQRICEIEEKKPPSSWPTLEILPGGVIKKPQKSFEPDPLCQSSYEEDIIQPGQMMYACAKCSQTFKFLFSLVKHVKWHEVEAKKAKANEVVKIIKHSNTDCTHKIKNKLSMCLKTHKKRTPKKLKS